ncbi:MAG: hypothetical protein NTW87_14995 [Planctomycetota bacterium]|nr:hypothetical protein [Planctomycetota bacterium]
MIVTQNEWVCLLIVAQLLNLLFAGFVLARTLRMLKARGRLKYSLAALVVLVVVLGHVVAALVFAGLEGLFFVGPVAAWTVTFPFFLHLGRPERDIEAMDVLSGALLGFFVGVVCTVVLVSVAGALLELGKWLLAAATLCASTPLR